MPSSLRAALALFLGFGTPSILLAHEGGPSRFNYRDHIRPLLEKRCGACHRRGGPAPMTLLEYDEVVPWSRTMMIQILEASMPPWLPADGVGEFLNARSLSAAEINMLIDWAVGELPEGEPIDVGDDALLLLEDPFEDRPTAVPGPPREWSLGDPDLVLRPETGVSIEVGEEEKLVCLPLPVALEGPRVVEAFEVRPGLANVVQRATLYRSGSCDDRGRPLFTWLPDQKSISVSGGLGEPLPVGSPLSVEIFYRRGWEVGDVSLEDRTEVGIWFASATEPVQSVRITHRVYSFPTAVELLAIFPDPSSMDDLQPFRVEARFPGGQVIPLLVIERYDPTWREKYQLREPMRLPQGAEIRLSRPAAWIDFTPTQDKAE
ncbi:MAG TPA: hypothetical protein VEK15_14725 [Vicinamibacteria bacterium]|nr:hypothetical protein [Vicinamibacteria bacterium]